MTVRRTLPARERSFVGAWCFVDHYGPDDVSASGGMDVAPHPHCGLATVSWLFSGEVEHRDSLGTVATVRPGEVNLMTAGRGISHSEVSTPATSVLHGAQLWVVLPEALAGVEPRFEHFVPPVVEVAAGVRAQVFVGSLFGSSSPVRVETPLVGAEVVLGADASVVLPVPDGFEVAVLVDAGSVVFGELAGRAGRAGRGRCGPASGRGVGDGWSGGGAAAGARRGAVRRGGGHVVELHRPHQRRRRGGARGVGGRGRGSLRGGGGLRGAGVRASRRRRCPGCG